MSKDKIIFLLLAITLFVSGSISTRVHIPFYFWIGLYIVMALYYMPQNKDTLVDYLYGVYGLSLIWILVKFVTTHDGIFVISNVLLPTSAVLLFYSVKMKAQFIVKLRKTILILFVINAMISIFEAYTHRLLISPESPGVINTLIGFRSSALLAHPLQNAMAMSTILGFILTDERIVPYKKYSLLVIGIISILCYNSRSSILLWGPFMLLYFGSLLFKSESSKKDKIKIISIMLFIFSLAISFILFGGLGDRIFGDLLDVNTQTRFEVWSIFDKASFEQYAVGFSEWELKLMMKDFSVEAIENSLIMFILYDGFIYTVIIIVLYAIIIHKLFVNYTHFQELFNIFIFICYANVNNSISASFFPLLVFLLCILSFQKLKSVNKSQNVLIK